MSHYLSLSQQHLSQNGSNRRLAPLMYTFRSKSAVNESSNEDISTEGGLEFAGTVYFACLTHGEFVD